MWLCNVLPFGESRWRVHENFVLYLQLLHKPERVLKWKLKKKINKYEDSVQPRGPWMLDLEVDRKISWWILGPKKTCGQNGPPFLTPDPDTSCSRVTVANVAVTTEELAQGMVCMPSPSLFNSLITCELLGITCAQIFGSHLGYNVNWKRSVSFQPGQYCT